MPVFEAKNLGTQFEGHALLAAILHPTRAAQTRALSHGRQRAERAAAMADPMTIEPRYQAGVDGLTPTPVAAT